jgi:hypothetical protein
MKCIIKLGNIVDGLINVITLGWGKDLAGWIAKRFFNSDDCGCEARRIYLNELCGCREGIKL